MNTFTRTFGLITIAIVLSLNYTVSAEPLPEENNPDKGIILEEVASSQRQWTGVAVSGDGRIFANFPRWSTAVSESVVEVMPDGKLKAYPNQDMNVWDDESDPGERFVCVQSVYCGDSGFLWALDTGNPVFTGVLPGGAKLVKIDLSADEVVQTFVFDAGIAPPKSYLNDVRIDNDAGYAYITDSGIGALVVLDLRTGEARRVLEGHYSTRAEDITLTINGKAWVYPDGTPIRIHSDGIALNPGRDYLYYQALTGRTLYRIPTTYLRDPDLSDEDLTGEVEKVTESGAADGIMFDSEGNLYLSAIEDSAIKRFTADGNIETLIVDEKISWPDSFALGSDGSVYFTTSRIHEGTTPLDEYKIFRLRY
ncbi:MAG: hypothetical protein GY771_04810 [bacterium]|nr:hypothetical protein [bacterium]